MDETYVNKQTVVLYIQKDIHKERNTEGIYTRRGIQKDIHTERHIQHESIYIKEQTYGGTYTRSGYTHRRDIYTEGYTYRGDIHGKIQKQIYGGI